MDLKVLLKLLSQKKNKDIQSAYDDFVLALDILINFIDYLSDIKVNLSERFEYFEVQLVKLALVSKSLAKLFEGVDLNLNGKSVSFPDLSSIYILKRAQLENYMIFYYLYEDDMDDNQAVFRYLLYKVSGLNNRQKFKTDDIEELNRVKDKEKKVINELKLRIKENDYFMSLNLRDRKRILKSLPAKEMSWESLFKDSILNSDLFFTQWKLYSNYAHSEQISSMQIKAYFYNIEELNLSVYHSIETSIYIVCLAIVDLKNRFNEIENKFNSLDEETRTKIMFRYSVSLKKE